MSRFDRRTLLKLAGAACGAAALPRAARAQSAGPARRVIFFYFPDGVAGQSQEGQPSLWHAAGSEHSFSLPSQMEALRPHQSDCVFFNNLSSGPTDSGSHPGGAKKLLTAVDGGGGESIDQHLARTVGQSAPHRHLYLGVMANHNNASGDKHISYVGPGQSVAPEDSPARAFERLFSAGAPSGGPTQVDPRQSMIDGVRAELSALQARLGDVEQSKLSLHLEALREVEGRIQSAGMAASCSGAAPGDGALYEPERFPELMRQQIDVMVSAMACGMTKVGVLQASHHTSELIMSRFAGTEMHDPSFDMRSHQASHYGPRHDENHREFRDYTAQRRWFVAQFAYLLEQLKARPEGESTMLDHSLVLLCSEVSDGNTHSHDNLPFVLAGRGGGLRTGRLIQPGYARHADLLVSIARAMGSDINRFGQNSSGPLAGL